MLEWFMIFFMLLKFFLDEQKPFFIIISIASKIEGFKNLNPDDDKEEEEYMILNMMMLKLVILIIVMIKKKKK